MNKEQRIIKAHFYPDIDKDFSETGVMSYVSFQRLHPFLEQAIALRANERLVGIIVDELGIKCKIESQEISADDLPDGSFRGFGK